MFYIAFVCYIISSKTTNNPRYSRRITDRNPSCWICKTWFENEIHLRQIAENIEQVVWLRDIRSGRILYVSPAFETVWGRSSESLYADPLILIESVHPEDRVQVMVARPHYDHKPFNQAYRILRPDGSLRWIFARTFLIRNETGESD